MAKTQIGHEVAVVNGVSIGYYGRHTGEGIPHKTVLVLHGAMGNAQTTMDFANELAVLRPDIGVFQIDNPGHGTSEGQAYSTIQEISDVVKSFVVHMQKSAIFSEEIILVGHSMGGTIAAQVVLDGFPVQKLVMMQSAVSWPTLSFLADTPEEVFPAAFHELMVNEFEAIADFKRSRELIQRIPEMGASHQACAADIKALLSVDLTNRLTEIAVPTLIVQSASDITATRENTEKLIHSIPNTTTCFLKHGTHTSVIGEYKRIAQAVAEFI